MGKSLNVVAWEDRWWKGSGRLWWKRESGAKEGGDGGAYRLWWSRGISKSSKHCFVLTTGSIESRETNSGSLERKN